MSDNTQMISAAFGNRPIATGAAVKTFVKPAYGMKVYEDTTITVFKDPDDVVKTLGWESVVIPAGESIWFGTPIKKITVTVGGKGCYFLNESDL